MRNTDDFFAMLGQELIYKSLEHLNSRTLCTKMLDNAAARIALLIVLLKIYSADFTESFILNEDVTRKKLIEIDAARWQLSNDVRQKLVYKTMEKSQPNRLTVLRSS